MSRNSVLASVGAISVLTSVTFLVLFGASSVRAADIIEEGGGYAGYTDYSYLDAGYTDYGYSDAGYTDYSYTDAGYTDYSYLDAGYTDYSYSDAGYTDYSYLDSGYSDYNFLDSGYSDYNYLDAGYSDYGFLDAGYTDYAFADKYDVYDVYDVYKDQSGVEYSYSDKFAQSSYSTPSCVTCQSFSQPRPTSFPSAPFPITSPSYPPSRPPSYPPSYPPVQPPRPQPQPPVVFPPQQQSSNLTTNTCVGNSCNTNVNNIDNSINSSFNTATLAQVTPQPLVQYIAPPIQQQGLYCVITASPNYIQNGQAAILSWTSYGAMSAWLSDGIGLVAPNGSLAVRPNVSTNYTLTINGYGGVRTCTTYVNVSGAPYVSLSQIPYTGFDLGTFGNAIYWVGLLAFAFSGAYLVLYYKGGAGLVLGSVLPTVRFTKPNIVRRVTSAPAMFSKASAPKAFAPVRVSHAPEALPVARAEVSPKDTMTFAHSSQGEVPRIVVNRG